MKADESDMVSPPNQKSTCGTSARFIYSLLQILARKIMDAPPLSKVNTISENRKRHTECAAIITALC
jgi:hypothetical protein